MKGILFTEFIELVEEQFSIEMAEELIDECELATGGAYTSVGSYDHGEFVRLRTRLSERSGVPVRDLLMSFGRRMFERFRGMYPEMFANAAAPIEFLENVEAHIHVEVRKLYPDADLPRLATRRLDPDTLEIEYRSSRGLGDLAEALVRGGAN